VGAYVIRLRRWGRLDAQAKAENIEWSRKQVGSRQCAQEVSRFTGRAITFILAVAAIVVWGISGPLFGFSDTWQLVINTATTIITFLMVFVIQNTQNRDTAAMHIKID